MDPSYRPASAPSGTGPSAADLDGPEPDGPEPAESAPSVSRPRHGQVSPVRNALEWVVVIVWLV